jgi:hypothetical protein
MTITVWNFSAIWGILLHISISLLDVGHAPGRYRVAGAFSCLDYTTKCKGVRDF